MACEFSKGKVCSCIPFKSVLSQCHKTLFGGNAADRLECLVISIVIRLIFPDEVIDVSH